MVRCGIVLKVRDWLCSVRQSGIVVSEFVLIRLGTAVTDSHVRLRTGADRQSRMVSDSRVRVRDGSRGMSSFGRPWFGSAVELW